MIGRTLSHYKILSEISRGGMGIVYRALDLKLDREVALKVLPPELVADPERKRRFVQEAKAAAKLEHPHIGVVHEIDEVEGTTFIAMELIRGEQLRDTITKGPVPLRSALEIATDIAEGLAKAHDEGIVHRDLKPANIMVTDYGHTKIIDFGLAKLVEPLAGEGSDVETLTRGETDPGKVMGTVSYMSPEQARGQKLDHRSDIFSFGIVLHEMIVGQTPFKGDSAVETLNAILKEPTPRLHALDSELTEKLTFELQHIIDKCLSKDPAERYQTIEDTAVDLRAARRHLESGPVTSSVPKPSRKGWLIAGFASLIALGLAGWLIFAPGPVPEQSPNLTASQPSIAVLLFDNINKDPDLDWMRLGLAEMLVTDLSQSPHMDVVPTDRIYRILKELDSLEESVSSIEVVQEVAERADVETVLLGSYMKAGETIRVNIRVQEADSGKILSTERVEAVGQSDIFSKVDDLTRRLRASFDVPTSANVPRLEEVTTSSPEAYRYFVEGRILRNEQKDEEAIPLLEKAIEIDPNFLTAMTNLATAHWNLGHDKKAESIAKQALTLERIPEKERCELEFRLYSLREETFDRAIEVFRRLIKLGRRPNNLAVRYRILERYDEALELLEEDLRRQGGSFVNLNYYQSLGGTLIASGQYERARKLLQGMVAKYPQSAVAHHELGTLFVFQGKLDDAEEEFDRAESLLASYPRAQNGRWWVYVLRNEWDKAAEEVQKLKESKDNFHNWKGWMNDAWFLLHRGHWEKALTSLDKAGEVPPEPGRLSGLSHALAGHVTLEKDKSLRSLEHVRKAQNDGKGNIAEWEGLFVEGVALAKLGRIEAANKKAEQLSERTRTIPTDKEKRRHYHMMGEIARVRGDSRAAIDHLMRAQSMLPPHGHGGRLSTHRFGVQPYVPIWYSLASAYLEARDEDKAAEWFRKITESTVEHVQWPIPYARSFYFLGKIHENRGEMDKARENYRRFYEYWKDGDMDRERVEEAKKKLGGT